jgi:hypothetical protein
MSLLLTYNEIYVPSLGILSSHNLQIQDQLATITTYNGNQNNLISLNFVAHTHFSPTPHAYPYYLGWVQ